MKIAAIIQARMGSTRLPGKVLRKLFDYTVLGHTILRLSQVSEINEIIVATTTLSQDDAIVDEAKQQNVLFSRGSVDDVLSRYYEAALENNVDVIIRITSDCPLIDPSTIEKVLKHFKTEKVDYASNTLERSYPRGLDVEIFSMDALKRMYFEASKPEQREHVTPFIYQNPEMFRLYSCRNVEDYSKYRWTLDTVEDWNLIHEIYHRLYHPGEIISFDEVIRLMKQYPELHNINSHVEQKKLTE
jgi:spore coat polysaccharide biosynthesis protein SpsF